MHELTRVEQQHELLCPSPLSFSAERTTGSHRLRLAGDLKGTVRRRDAHLAHLAPVDGADGVDGVDGAGGAGGSDASPSSVQV